MPKVTVRKNVHKVYGLGIEQKDSGKKKKKLELSVRSENETQSCSQFVLTVYHWYKT